MLPGITPALVGGGPGGNDANTVFLLHGDGQNNSRWIYDSSPKVHGSAYGWSGTPLISTNTAKFGGTSILLNGASYPVWPDSPDWEFGSGDFTVDWWEYRTAATASSCTLVRNNSNQTYQAYIIGYTDGTSMQCYMSGDGASWAVSALPLGPVALNSWQHYAVVRKGSTFYGFRNGVLQGTVTYAGALLASSGSLSLGLWYPGSVIYFTGYIDELRISKGIARWTANFAVPTVPYGPSPDLTTVLLLHADGTDGSTAVVDSSPMKHSNANIGGSAKQASAQKKFGPTSLSFPGGSVSIITENSCLDWEFGTDDFTIDWWEYRTALTTGMASMARDYNVAYSPFLLGYSDGTNRQVYMSSAASTWDIAVSRSLGAITLNTWEHLAVVRKGTNFYAFKNGILTDSWSSSLGIIANSGNFTIGGYNSAANCMSGYIDEVRVSRKAIWTANFTPPGLPYGANPADYVVRLLLHFDAPDNSVLMPDASIMAHGYATITGAAKVSVAQSKFGGSAYSNDGSTSYIQFPDSPDWDFQGDFTIDMWVWINALPPTSSAWCFASQYGGGNEYWLFFTNETGNVYCQNTLAGTTYYTNGPTPLVPNQWAHVAIVRSAGVQKVYVNGVGGAAEPQHINADIAGPLQIGVFASGAYAMNGYIDELRITNGLAQWTANFTPPAAPYPPPLVVPAGPATPQTIAIGPGPTTWTVPNDWINTKNTIEVIGGGGGAANSVAAVQSGGGGGGGYAKFVNFAATPGQVIPISVGAGGGAGGAGGGTWFNSTSTVYATGGNTSGTNAGGAGGGAAAGSSGFTGGSGAAGYATGRAGGGGGGAAGMYANGVSPPNINNTTSQPGGAGDGGNGGAGGGAMAAGGNGAEWGSWGSGGGGGGGNNGSNGFNAGYYGGGGGGAGGGTHVGGAGGPGLLIIKYG